MKSKALLTALLTAAALAVALAGCGRNPFLTMQQTAAGGNMTELSNDQPRTAAPRRPVNGDWVIVLTEVRGPTRQKAAERVKDYLLANKWQSVGVIHDSDQQMSFVYFGPFQYDKKVLEDRLKSIKEWQDPRSRARPFRGAYMLELPQPDPSAPDQWNLVNAPGYWTLQIAHYVEPGPAWPATAEMQLPPGWNRKQAAVDACKALRELNIPAYYYHGDKMSMVTVGAFPAEVFAKLTDSRGTLRGYRGYDPKTDEYASPLINELRYRVFKDAEGKDEQIFRYNLQNGLKVIKRRRGPNGQVIAEPYPSLLVKIPKATDDFGL